MWTLLRLALASPAHLVRRGLSATHPRTVRGWIAILRVVQMRTDAAPADVVGYLLMVNYYDRWAESIWQRVFHIRWINAVGKESNSSLKESLSNAVADVGQFPSPHVPYCFYPRKYVGYALVNRTRTATGATAFFKRSLPSNIDADINLLRVDVVQQTEHILRIKVFDPLAKRWEPPLPAPPAPVVAAKYTYSFILSTDGNLQVFRWDHDRATTKMWVILTISEIRFCERFRGRKRILWSINECPTSLIILENMHQSI